jgi:hypothetical protein
MSYDNLRERLDATLDLEFGSGVAEEDIGIAEGELGASFPSSYRHLLRDYGWVAFGPYEFFGMGPGVPPFLDLVRVTNSERTEAVPPLPPTLLPVRNDGGGNLFCLDTGSLVDGECQVVLWSHAATEAQVPEWVADDFSTWLMSLLDQLAQ